MSIRGKLIAYLTILFNFLLFFSYLAFLADPTKAVWIAFTGLAYPIILLINICLCLVWLIKRKLFFLPTLLLIIAGMYHHSRFFQLNPFSKFRTENVKSIKVMSFNVTNFDLYNNWEGKTKERIFNHIKEVQPDIICFQEYVYDKSKKDRFSTREVLNKDLGYKYFHEEFAQNNGRNHFFGVATFSKYPVISKHNIQHVKNEPAQCIWSDIVIDNDTLRVFNAYFSGLGLNHTEYKALGSNRNPIYSHMKAPIFNFLQFFKKIKKAYRKRSKEVKTTVSFIKKSPYKVVLCADMNDTPISYSYNKLDKHLKDPFTYSGFGFGGTLNFKYLFALRSDYIWHDKKLTSKNYTTHESELSDHKSISVKINLPD